jgi:poly(3-hydroxybutyrate) depolymerase
MRVALIAANRLHARQVIDASRQKVEAMSVFRAIGDFTPRIHEHPVEGGEAGLRRALIDVQIDD